MRALAPDTVIPAPLAAELSAALSANIIFLSLIDNAVEFIIV